VPESYRGAAEIRWLVCWPQAPYWPDSGFAADALISGCLTQLRRWSPTRCTADGALPAPGVYGVPEQWPHVRELYQRAGFRVDGPTETVLLARVTDLPRPGPPPIAGLSAQRSLGINGTRISAVLDGRTLGFVEVDGLDAGPRAVRAQGWADVGNLQVDSEFRRRGVGRWLIAEAGDWLGLGDVGRLLAYTEGTDRPDDADSTHDSNGTDDGAQDDAGEFRFLISAGFRILTRTIRSYRLPDHPDRPVQPDQAALSSVTSFKASLSDSR
jgi:GNAT superfamily N-acetyltransferase